MCVRRSHEKSNASDQSPGNSTNSNDFNSIIEGPTSKNEQPPTEEEKDTSPKKLIETGELKNTSSEDMQPYESVEGKDAAKLTVSSFSLENMQKSTEEKDTNSKNSFASEGYENTSPAEEKHPMKKEEKEDTSPVESIDTGKTIINHDQNQLENSSENSTAAPSIIDVTEYDPAELRKLLNQMPSWRGKLQLVRVDNKMLSIVNPESRSAIRMKISLAQLYANEFQLDLGSILGVAPAPIPDLLSSIRLSNQMVDDFLGQSGVMEALKSGGTLRMRGAGHGLSWNNGLSVIRLRKEESGTGFSRESEDAEFSKDYEGEYRVPVVPDEGSIKEWIEFKFTVENKEDKVLIWQDGDNKKFKIKHEE
ncbi:MAG: hypothetical protein LBP65_03785 [Puniceicoccales bacterium]|jgi:hypothetical protein|nr:hypothetical protein [Puniceicoccales bacterium]